jgi:exosortase H (IPTLxxWG-CTERM-specific)
MISTAQPPAASSFQKRMRRFLILFPLCLIAGFGLLEVPFVSGGIAGFTRALVQISASLIHLLGGHANVYGVVLQSPVNGFAVRVENGCNAVNVTILLWAAILTYPAGWLQKLMGLAAGTFAIQTVNLVRVISLYYLGQYNQSWFDFAHMYLWESLIVIDTLVVFWIWASMVRKSVTAGNAAAQ